MVALATAVAMLDVFFIILIVPESLATDQKMTMKSLTLKQMNPFESLRGIVSDRKVLLMSLVAVLSYLPEAGQATCFFVYLTLVLNFSPMKVSIFICYRLYKRLAQNNSKSSSPQATAQNYLLASNPGPPPPSSGRLPTPGSSYLGHPCLPILPLDHFL